MNLNTISQKNMFIATMNQHPRNIYYFYGAAASGKSHSIDRFEHEKQHFELGDGITADTISDLHDTNKTLFITSNSYEPQVLESFQGAYVVKFEGNEYVSPEHQSAV